MSDSNATNRGTDYIGNALSGNIQRGTNTTTESMQRLLDKVHRSRNVGFEQAKGHIFEELEGAKLETNLANAGTAPIDKHVVTDTKASSGGYGDPHAPDDFRIQRNGKVVSQGQAKVNNDPHDTAVNFANEKYKGMQRVTTKENVPKVRKECEEMLRKGEISQETYDDIMANLSDKGMTDTQTGVSSGGTTKKEIESFRGKDGKVSEENAKRYARRFKTRQGAKEIATTGLASAGSAIVMTSITSSVTHACQLIDGSEDIEDAAFAVVVDTAKAGTRGLATGSLSAGIRIVGVETGVEFLAEGMHAMSIAGTVVDSATLLFGYAKGDLSAKELSIGLAETTTSGMVSMCVGDMLKNTTIGAKIAAGPAWLSVLAPFAIYSAASVVVSSVFNMLRSAQLEKQEAIRLAALYKEAAEEVVRQRMVLEQFFDDYISKRAREFSAFLDRLDGCMFSNDYNSAIDCMVDFSNKLTIQLKHVKFDDFRDSVASGVTFAF